MEKPAKNNQMRDAHLERIKTEENYTRKTERGNRVQNWSCQKSIFCCFTLENSHPVVLLFVFFEREELHRKDFYCLNTREKIDKDRGKFFLISLQLARHAFY